MKRSMTTTIVDETWITTENRVLDVAALLRLLAGAGDRQREGWTVTGLGVRFEKPAPLRRRLPR